MEYKAISVQTAAIIGLSSTMTDEDKVTFLKQCSQICIIFIQNINTYLYSMSQTKLSLAFTFMDVNEK
jgi:hypothetical protein